MSPRGRSIALAASAASIGVIVGWGAASLYFDREYHTPMAQLRYSAQASRAKFEVRLLELLRSGDIARLTKALEFELDSTITDLDFYQQQDPTKFRKEDIEDSVARVREYRKKYPSPNTGTEVAAAVGRALSQGERASAP